MAWKHIARYYSQNRDSYASAENDAEPIWDGDNYVLFRGGLESDKGRYVYLVDKIGLEVDKDSPNLVKLAGGWHPVRNLRVHKPEVLHSSRESDAGTYQFDGRWSKSMRLQVIRFAKQRDASYDTDLDGWIKEWEEKQEIQKAEKRKKKEIARACRKTAQAFGEVSLRSKWGPRYELTMKSNGIEFSINPSDDRVQLRPESFNLPVSELERFLTFMSGLKPVE